MTSTVYKNFSQIIHCHLIFYQNLTILMCKDHIKYLSEQPDNITQSKANVHIQLEKMLHLSQQFVSDGGKNH